MAEPVGDEFIFLRLDLLRKGLVQFTDATTAPGCSGNTAGTSGTTRRGRNG
jgi:hypothetical protein